MVFLTDREKALDSSIGGNVRGNVVVAVNQDVAVVLIKKAGCQMCIRDSLLVSLTPNTNLSVFVRSIKTQISREMRSKYPDKIGKYLYGKDTPFWSESYFVATTGTVSMETVKGYIESQKTEAHQKRAYRKRQLKKL